MFHKKSEISALILGGRKGGVMPHRFGLCILVSAVIVLNASCTKLGEPAPGAAKLSFESLTQPDSIPAKWGKLVSVSSTTTVEGWCILWFQDDEGNIRAVRYNVRDNYLPSKSVIIHRN